MKQRAEEKKMEEGNAQTAPSGDVNAEVQVASPGKLQETEEKRARRRQDLQSEEGRQPESSPDLAATDGGPGSQLARPEQAPAPSQGWKTPGQKPKPVRDGKPTEASNQNRVPKRSESSTGRTKEPPMGLQEVWSRRQGCQAWSEAPG